MIIKEKINPLRLSTLFEKNPSSGSKIIRDVPRSSSGNSITNTSTRYILDVGHLTRKKNEKNTKGYNKHIL